MAIGRTGVFASAHMCTSKTKIEIIDDTKNMELLKKNRVRGSSRKTYETVCTEDKYKSESK